MPPQSEDPQSIRPKTASPSIFSALRTLTGQKKPSTSASASATPTLDSDSVPAFLPLDTSASLSKQSYSLPANGTKASNGVDTGIQLGGPPQLQRLLDSLGPERDLEDRIRAADAISSLLSDYPVANVSPIWHRAKDLISSRNKRNAFDAGYNLMLACINHAPLLLIEKPLFFASASSPSLLDQPSLSLRALTGLTDNGKTFEGLDSHQLAPLLVSLLDRSYDAAVAARKIAKSNKTAAVSNDEITLTDVFQYFVDSIKFNAKVFQEAQLAKIIDHVLLICKKTRSESDLEHSLLVLETVITYSALPKVSLRDCLEVICGMFCSVEKLKLQSKSTFSKLLQSYLGPEVHLTLHAILNENPGKPVQDRNVVRGAVQLLREVVRENLHDQTAKLSISDILPALRQSLALNSVRLELDILGLLCLFLQDTRDVVDLVFADQEWTEFYGIVVHCSTGKAMAMARSSTPVIAKPTEQSLKSKKYAALSPGFTETFQRLADQLLLLSQDAELDRKLSIMALLLDVSLHLDDASVRSVIEFYVDERLLLPSQDKWLDNCQQMRKVIFLDNKRSLAVRLFAFEALCNAYNIAAALNVSDAGTLVLSLVEAVSSTTDLHVLEKLTDFAVDVAQWTTDFDIFLSVVEFMRTVLFTAQPGVEKSVELMPPRLFSGQAASGEQAEQDKTHWFSSTPTAIVTKSLVKMFLRCFNRSFEKTESLFHVLLSVARSSETPPDARIIALKVLTRIRADVSHAIFIVVDTESEDLAAALCRTAETAVIPESYDAPKRVGKEDEPVQKRQNQSIPTSPSQSSIPTMQPTRTTSNPHRSVTRPTPPLWMYPGPKGLPEDPPRSSSHVVYSHVDSPDQPTDETEKETIKRTTLKTGLLLELALDLLQRDDFEWETYSYLIVHLGAQLMNHALFIDAAPQIKLLRSVLCDLLQNKKFHEPPSFTNLKRSDVAICLYQILITLVSYRQHFAKSEEDEMVKTFVLGIGSWERTSEMCIHALSVCCHETPSSIVKYLDTALQRMVQIITQSTIAVHVLEFLAGLARLPNLFRNFRDDEFRSVFGICFRYLQYVRDQRNKPTSQVGKSISSSRSNRDTLSSSDYKGTGTSLAEALPQYVYALAYHVMAFWFISLRLQDRPRQMAWIRKNLIFTNERGEEVMEEQSLVTVDMMHRVAYSDRDETLPNENFAQEADGLVSSRSYLVGLSILTVATAGRTGVSHITIRRPSGNRCSVSRPQVAPRPRHQVDTTDAFYSRDYVGVTPQDVVQNLYSPLSISPALASLTEGPIPLPDDEATRRSIAAFDRISPLDGHKVGIIYVGEKQTSEAAILANVMGSTDYTALLHGLGTLTELQGATFNTQGLDREYGSDGKFTFCWRDRVSELVFHVTTMMPTDLEHDPQCSLKKRHIGNDFVNIIFNNSGIPFRFDTFPSDFNYVNIVITPEARTSFIETRLHAARRRHQRQEKRREIEMSEKEDGSTQEEPEDNLFYKVTVMTKPGLPKISPASETKIISGKNLAAFVRLLALNASVFAQVWANRAGGEHVSSWRSRLREIVRLRDRNAGTPEEQTTEHHGSPPPTAQGQSASNDRTSTRESVLMRRASAATFFSDGSANRSSVVSAVTAEPETMNSPTQD